MTDAADGSGIPVHRGMRAAFADVPWVKSSQTVRQRVSTRSTSAPMRTSTVESASGFLNPPHG